MVPYPAGTVSPFGRNRSAILPEPFRPVRGRASPVVPACRRRPADFAGTPGSG
ncbi:hypothetical protein P376_5444 [Streptomyces sp. HCCB10043]|nr:hypothetical protein P376_5444 [Streptomyces sp. HCCB10043]